MKSHHYGDNNSRVRNPRVQFNAVLKNALVRWLGESNGEQAALTVISYLENTNFYKSPASTRFHESYEGGLVQHSLNVYDKMLTILTSASAFNLFPEYVASDENSAKALVCALLHDLCKIDLYESYMRNVKNEKTGAWVKEAAFKYAEKRPKPMGHGVSSAWIAKELLPELTEEMAMAIIYHMGAYDVSQAGLGDMGDACRRYPLCYMLQFADLLSCAEYEEA
jgi:hypothetical protein